MLEFVARLPEGQRSQTVFYRSLQNKLGVSPIRSDKDLIALVENRLPVSSIKALMSSGVSDAEIYRLVLPRRTLAHWVAKHEELSKEESDRAVRLARIAVLAEQVFGERERAWRWMRQAKRRFSGRSPVELLQTEAGARVIEEMLYQIDYGMAA